MKTLKINSFQLITLLCLIWLNFSCSSDDDSSDNALPTTLDLLTSGTWYLESKSQGSYSACQKESSIDFMSNGSAIFKIVGESVDGCEEVETFNTIYTLNESTIMLILIDDNLVGVVTYDASLQTLIITENEGAYITLDKVKG